MSQAPLAAQATDSATSIELSAASMDCLLLSQSLADLPIQQQILQTAFERVGQSADLEQALSRCQKLGLALQVDLGLWSIDQNVSRYPVALTSEHLLRIAELKQALISYLIDAIDGKVDANLTLDDIEHIRCLSADPQDDLQCDLLIWLADFDYQGGRFDLAAQNWQSVYLFVKQQQGAEHPDTLACMNNFAESLQQQGAYVEAQELYQEQLSLCLSALGEEDDSTLTCMNNLAAVLKRLHQLDEAKALEERVVELRLRLLGAEHPDTLGSQNNLASTLKALGNIAEARALQEQVLSVRRQIFPERHPHITEAAWNLLQTLFQQGEYQSDLCQEVLFDDLLWLLEDKAVLQHNTEFQIKELLQKLLNQG
ncbi:Tetratricopeptide repeat-containing protein [Oceanospirillum multiglobuliferum]|uniref:Tetratricopeptide repeat protein n=1 Tax=Oceanospirillum multiglobuliferum TaxID=64969 RepID=A0A1T4RN56_9GAMM|nr:tetratricopeptide repeat protein [Oceanospirillum multiglobuliferum]OPX54760.1 hypothetical protein BTE48_12715 [Oceanospirillum multiglobuliferum]SKA17178.1 Tetratricopeptide repeat-containing protein [Oceanospirillum multiglobuliferum]